MSERAHTCTHTYTLAETEGSIKDESASEALLRVILEALQFPVDVKLSTVLCGPGPTTKRATTNTDTHTHTAAGEAPTLPYQDQRKDLA